MATRYSKLSSDGSEEESTSLVSNCASMWAVLYQNAAIVFWYRSSLQKTMLFNTKEAPDHSFSYNVSSNNLIHYWLTYDATYFVFRQSIGDGMKVFISSEYMLMTYTGPNLLDEIRSTISPVPSDNKTPSLSYAISPPLQLLQLHCLQFNANWSQKRC